MNTNEPSTCFSLRGQSSSFLSRQDSIFGKLPIVQLSATVEHSTSSDSIMSVGETDASQIVDESKEEDIGKYKGEESIFKRPMPKLKRPSHRPRKQSLPLKKMPADHKRNPQKWIKYSLASTSEMTDRSNTAAAFSFLREMEERKAKEGQQQEEQLDLDKVVFKKPKTREDQASSSSRGYRDGKLLMPAFEFGSKKTGHKKKSKQAESTGSAGHNMTLQHLADPDGGSSSD